MWLDKVLDMSRYLLRAGANGLQLLTQCLVLRVERRHALRLAHLLDGVLQRERESQG